MIKFTLGELVDAQPVLKCVSESPFLPFKAAFHFGRALRKTAEDHRAYLDKQNALIEKFGEPQFEQEEEGKPAGKPLFKPDGSPLMGINPESPNWAEFVAALQEVRGLEIECAEVNPISIDAMGDQPAIFDAKGEKRSLTPNEVATVLWLFKENYDGTAAQE